MSSQPVPDQLALERLETVLHAATTASLVRIARFFVIRSSMKMRSSVRNEVRFRVSFRSTQFAFQVATSWWCFRATPRHRPTRPAGCS